MALTGSAQAYRQARSGIARSGASRSNAVWPLYGVITIAGRDVTAAIQSQTLRVSLALNEQPDTASMDVLIMDALIDAECRVGADVLVSLGGAGENPIFGGRILTTQTTRRHLAIPSLRSVLCADYLQVLDSEYLITYEWPAQSATVTILDLIARFANKPGGVPISTAGVQAGLPNHQKLTVLTERFSTLLRRLTVGFPNGGGFYVDAVKVLHVWQGASEPGVQNPAPLTLANQHLKAFAETEDNSQQRDAVIVEGLRTTAPLGTAHRDGDDPAFLYSLPVADASILDPVTDTGTRREVRIGTQRLLVRYAEGVWSAPVGTEQTTTVTVDAPYEPNPAFENVVYIGVGDLAFLTGRNFPWVRIDQQWLQVINYSTSPAPQIRVPRFGYGAQIGDIKAGAVVTVVDSFADIVTTGRYDTPTPEVIRPQPIDSDVVMVVRSVTGQAIHEQIVQDGRYSRSGATARGTREAQDFYQAMINIQFDTTDLAASPGRLQAYDLAPPFPDGGAHQAGEYMILTADLTWPKWGDPPRRTCTATDIHPADVMDAWLVDRR